MTKSERKSALPWSVPLALREVSEAGRHFDLVADAQTRAAVAKLAGLADLLRLDASFDVTLRGRSTLHVVGCVSATVGQTCVVTLEPVENEIEEPVDLVFMPAAALASEASGQRGHSKVRAALSEQEEVEVTAEDGPEALVDGRVDLGAIATEFLLLGIDPYPRKPGAVFRAPAGDSDSAHPFTALKKGGRER